MHIENAKIRKKKLKAAADHTLEKGFWYISCSLCHGMVTASSLLEWTAVKTKQLIDILDMASQVNATYAELWAVPLLEDFYSIRVSKVIGEGTFPRLVPHSVDCICS